MEPKAAKRSGKRTLTHKQILAGFGGKAAQHEAKHAEH